MLKIVLLIILVPILIGFGIMIAQFVSMLLMIIAMGIGAFMHRLFAGKTTHKWEAPEYLGLAQLTIIMGFVYAVYANVIGGVLNWHWLISIGSALDHIFAVFLILDMLTLVVLATIHGSFELLSD